MSASTKPGNRHWLFSHPEDKHCAIYNILVLCCYGTAFWLYLNPQVAHIEGPWSRLAFMLGAGFLLGWISGVNVGVNFHNHTHRPIFNSPFLNRWFERVWTFSGGWPAFYWYHSHVVVHHSNLMGETDWTMPHRRADGRFENLYLYLFLHWPWRCVPALWKDFRSARGGPDVPRRALKEGLIFLALWSIPFMIDPVMALGLWLFPQWVANAVIMGSGMYVQHAGAVQKSDERLYHHSNSFLSRFFNLTMFNIGYHIVHHDYDQVHWSVLPAFHRRMRQRLIDNDAHVVSYGYYHAAHLCSLVGRTEEGFHKFVSDEAPGYERQPTKASPRQGPLESMPAASTLISGTG